MSANTRDTNEMEALKNGKFEAEMEEELHEESVYNQQANPLMNNVVLKTVFGFLDYKSLEICKLVCKTWLDESSSYFKKKSISIPDKFNKYALSTEVTTTPSSYRRFYEEDFPFGLPSQNLHISLKYLPFKMTPPVLVEGTEVNNIGMIKKWLGIRGADLKGLRFDLGTDVRNVDRTKVIMNILTTWCPNLEVLEINHVNEDSVGAFFIDDHKNFEDVELPKLTSLSFNVVKCKLPKTMKLVRGTIAHPHIEALFKAAVNLENVEVSTRKPKFSHSVASCITKYVGKQLKRLTWKKFLYPNDLIQLQDIPIESTLKVLNLDCELFPVTSMFKLLKNLLARLSQTLEVLTVKGKFVERWSDISSDDDNSSENYSDTDSSENEEIVVNGGNPVVPVVPQNPNDQVEHYNDFLPFTFPLMDKLIVFELNDMFHCRVGTFDFVLELPNLKRLKLKNVTYASVVRPLRPDDVFAQLVTSPMEVLLAPHTELEELYLDGTIMNPDFIDGIAVAFPNLKILDISVEKNEVFVAVFQKMSSLEELNMRFSKVNDLEWCTSALLFHLPKLKELRMLKLNNIGAFPFPIPEVVIREGFTGAPKLRSLELTNFSFCKEDVKTIMEHLEDFHSVKFIDCIQTLPFNYSH